MLQEHHLPEHRVDAEERWAKTLGWSCSLDPAVPTAAGGTSGGVGLVTKGYRGMAKMVSDGEGFADMGKGRIAIRKWDGVIDGGVLVVSVYLVVGNEDGAENRQLLSALAEELLLLGMPFIIGGDWNMNVDMLEGTLFPHQVRGVVVAPRGSDAKELGTCRGLAGKWSTIDYFVISELLANRVIKCDVLTESRLRPHRAVELQLGVSGPLPPIRVLRAARRFPKLVPFGPLPRLTVDPRLWVQVEQSCAQGDLDEAASLWFDAAEQDMATIMQVGEQQSTYTGRGKDPSFKWVSPEVKHHRGRPRTSARARALFWCTDRLKEIAFRDPWSSVVVRLRHQVEAWFFCQPPGELDARLGLISAMSKDDLLEVANDLDKKAKLEQQAFLKTKRAKLKEWALASVEKGAKRAHAFVKQVGGWRPDPTPFGCPLSAQARVDDLGEQWAKTWECQSESILDAEHLWQEFEDSELGRPSVQDVIDAAMTFPIDTGLGADQWHPRHFGIMDKRGIDLWINLMLKAEAKGCIPSCFRLLTIVFIPKAGVGVRPIGLFTASLRLWGRLRSAVAKSWALENDREYFWGGAGRSALRCVWRQALAAEYCQPTGRQAATIMFDLTKAYELLTHRMVAVRILNAGVPMRYGRWCLLSYAAPRVLRLGQAYSTTSQINTSIVAGCSGATFLLRAVLLATVDVAWQSLAASALRGSINVFVDDIAITLEAKEDEPLAPSLAGLALELARGLEDDIGGQISDDKTVILASTTALGDEIAEELSGRWSSVLATKNLGVDFSLAGASSAVQKHRMTSVKAKIGKMNFLKVQGGPSQLVARTAINPIDALRRGRRRLQRHHPRGSEEALWCLCLRAFGWGQPHLVLPDLGCRHARPCLRRHRGSLGGLGWGSLEWTAGAAPTHGGDLVHPGWHQEEGRRPQQDRQRADLGSSWLLGEAWLVSLFFSTMGHR